MVKLPVDFTCKLTTYCIKAICTDSLAKMTFSNRTGDLLHEVSNEGAREQFKNEFLEEHILHVMISCAKVFGSIYSYQLTDQQVFLLILKQVIVPAFNRLFVIFSSLSHCVF